MKSLFCWRNQCLLVKSVNQFQLICQINNPIICVLVLILFENVRKNAVYHEILFMSVNQGCHLRQSLFLNTVAGCWPAALLKVHTDILCSSEFWELFKNKLFSKNLQKTAPVTTKLHKYIKTYKVFIKLRSVWIQVFVSTLLKLKSSCYKNLSTRGLSNTNEFQNLKWLIQVKRMSLKCSLCNPLYVIHSMCVNLFKVLNK